MRVYPHLHFRSYSFDVVVAKPSQERSGERTAPLPSPIFTGREDILDVMASVFLASSSNRQKRFVLYGLGGSGKSQISYKFIDKYKERYRCNLSPCVASDDED